MMSSLHKIGFVVAVIACFGGLVSIWNYRVAEGEMIGYADGFQAGNTTGYLKGYELGYDEGYSEGKRVGYRDGSVVGYDEGYVEGYKTGYPQGETDGYSSGLEKGLSDGLSVWDKSQGYLMGIVDGAKGYTIRDPTYQEAMNFIRFDDSDQVPSGGFYYDHVASFKKNAHEVGYRCFWVYVKLRGGTVTELVAFNTIDRKMIFIDPKTDKLVSISVGKPYWDRSRYDVTYDDTVVSYDLIP